MDNTITISTERYERLCAIEFAMKILLDNRYSPVRQSVLDAVMDTMAKEEDKC